MTRAGSVYHSALPYLLRFCTSGRRLSTTTPSILGQSPTHHHKSHLVLVRCGSSLNAVDTKMTKSEMAVSSSVRGASQPDSKAVDEAIARRLREMQSSSSSSAAYPSSTFASPIPTDHPASSTPPTSSQRQRRLDLASIPMLSSRGAYLPPSPAQQSTAAAVPVSDQDTSHHTPSAASPPLESSSSPQASSSDTTSSHPSTRSPLPASPTQPADTGWRQILEQARQQQQRQQQDTSLSERNASHQQQLIDTFG